MQERIKSIYYQKYHSEPEMCSSAPGRINIIGEHTDYNMGFVLPAAINLKSYFLFSRRCDNKVIIWAENYKEEATFSIGDYSKSEDQRWTDYIKGILWVLEKAGYKIPGFNGLIYGEVPLEAGLSSSAALEVSIIFGLNALAKCEISTFNMAKMAQKAENEFVGVKCGFMDQFISVFGQKNQAVFLDCLTFDFQAVPIFLDAQGLSILVIDSCVKRELTGSEYNQRSSESNSALKILNSRGISNFRDASIQVIDEEKTVMGCRIYKRARHVIEENERVLKALEAMRLNDYASLGELLFQSHVSLRDNYEVSCPELDLLYEIGKRFDGCLGSRMTGAGFGGSGIALLESGEKENFKNRMIGEAKKKGYPKPIFYDVEIGQGAEVISLEHK